MSVAASISNTVHGCLESIRRLSYREILLLAVLTILGVGTTLAYMIFAEGLGFNMYPDFQLILLALLLLLVPFFSKLTRRLPTGKVFSRNELISLGVVLAATFTLRVFYALTASIFPDEYWVLLILESHPWRNLGYFFLHYVEIAWLMRSHPPLSFLLMSFGYEIYPTPLGARMVSVIFGTATVAVLYFIMDELGAGKFALPVAALYGIFPHTLLFMTTALTDVYMNFFGLLALLFGIRSIRSEKFWYSVLSGFALGLSLLSKQGLGILWGILLLFAVFFVKPKQISLVRALGAGVVSLILGLGVLGSWYFLNPAAFFLSVPPIIRYVTTVPLSPQSYNLGKCCFQPVNGMWEHISYADLVLQLPVWLTPLVTLLALVGVGLAVQKHQRQDVWWLMWAIGPLMAMIPLIRDIRYALFIAPATAYFAWMGIGRVSRRVRRTVLGLTLVFVIMFISMTATIAQQQYWGVQEASAEVVRLGYGSSVVLTNAVSMTYTLPHAEILNLTWSYNWTQVDQMIRENNVSVVVVLHNTRSPWPVISPEITTDLRSLFSGYEMKAISNFASYEIFYARDCCHS